MIDVYSRFSRDAGSFLAATISYYALFSIFPLFLLAISAAGYFLAEVSTSDAILDYTKEVLPQFSGVVRNNVKSISTNRESTGLIGLVALVWIGTAVFDALAYAMNRVWHVKAARHIFWSKLLSVAGVITVILVLIMTTLLSTVLDAFQVYWRETFSVAPPLETLGIVTFFAVQSITFSALVIIYAVTPNLELRFSDVWAGALFATVVLEVAKRLFVVYTTHVARFNAIYGSVGVIVGLLFWLYIMGIIVVLGAEINAALKHRNTPSEAH